MSLHSIWSFSALDSLFFRESRPMDALGNNLLSSVFPPPSSALIGAARHLIGEREGVDWHIYQQRIREIKQVQKKLRCFSRSNTLEVKPADVWIKTLGCPDDVYPLQFSGGFLCVDNKRLYPVPANLVQKKSKNTAARLELALLKLGEPMASDLGCLRFPFIDSEDTYVAMDGYLITETGLKQVLANQIPDKSTLITKAALFQMETRFGISRDKQTRVAQDGMLYQTRHVRPAPDVSLEMDLTGYAVKEDFNDLVRLGGEGRLAAVRVTRAEQPASLCATDFTNAKGLILINLSASPVTDNQALPAGFEIQDRPEQLLATGQLAKISLSIHSAVTGKAQ
ncbi:type III-B CRISPR module-associated Cmr3 family protein, partial [Candidatus Venteria ishoeyi]